MKPDRMVGRGLHAHFDAGDVVGIGECGRGVVVRTDIDLLETLPATWRRRFAAWVWRKWGRQ